jgi:hypothetical protein
MFSVLCCLWACANPVNVLPALDGIADNHENRALDFVVQTGKLPPTS